MQPHPTPTPRALSLDFSGFVTLRFQVSSYAWNCGINWLTRDAFFNSYIGGLGCYHVVEACDSLGDACVKSFPVCIFV